MSKAARRVFLSHTSEFQSWPERSFIAAAESAVTRARDAVVDMRYFTADTESSAAHCKHRVAESDVYVGIVGFRYGMPVQDRPDLSHTELEYETAGELSIPRLVFVLADDAPVPFKVFSDAIHAARQEAFRYRLRQDNLILGVFRSPDQLEVLLLQALNDLRDPTPARGRRDAGRAFGAPSRSGQVISRPNLMTPLLELLCQRVPSNFDNGQPMNVVRLEGGGGFGKTTIAAEMCCHPRIAEHYPDGVLWITLGRISSAELASKLNDLSLYLSGARTTYTDVEIAGQHLGRLLGDSRRLLVIDDVWQWRQLEPFLVGGAGCTRLITTRIRSGFSTVSSITVASMEQAESSRLLWSGLDVDRPTEEESAGLLRRASGWPLLLSLINASLRRYTKLGLAPREAGARVERALDTSGPAALDLKNPGHRASAVAATVESSLALLTELGPDWLDRYGELAVFSEETDVPLSSLALYWGFTGGLSADDTERLVLDLADLSLLQELSFDPPRIRLHRVLINYLRHRAGARLDCMHQALLDSYRGGLATEGGRTCWWQLDRQETYMWKHLAWHLASAGSADAMRELDEVACDLRWLEAKIKVAGFASAEADLRQAQSPLAGRLREGLSPFAHLLEPVGSLRALSVALLARLSHNHDLEPLVTSFRHRMSAPFFDPVWPLPDQGHPALSKALTGHRGVVSCLAISPTSDWFVAGSRNGDVRMWQRDGEQSLLLTAHEGGVSALVMAPDGDYFAAGCAMGGVKLWSTAGELVRRIPGRVDGVSALAISPDGTRLAVGGWDGAINLWSIPHSTKLGEFTAHKDIVSSVAFSPDGRSLVTGGRDGELSVWNAAPGSNPTMRLRLTSHVGPIEAVAVTPNGSWLVSAGWDGKVRVWEAESGQPHAVMHGHVGPVECLSVAADGRWLVTGGRDSTARVWSLPEGRLLGSLTGHTDVVSAAQISADGEWLATGSWDTTARIWTSPKKGLFPRAEALVGHVEALGVTPDGETLVTGGANGSVRIWDVNRFGMHAALLGHTGPVGALAVSRDGKWLVTGSWDCTARLWDLRDHRVRAVLTDHMDMVAAVAIAPTDDWMATGSRDGSLRVWGVHDQQLRSVLPGHVGGVSAVAISPDGTWLATGCWDGSVRVWGVHDQQLRSVLPGHVGGVSAVAISPDGAMAATGSWDGAIRVWELSTGDCAALLRTDGSVFSCSWMPSSSRLVATGSSGLFLLDFVSPSR